MTNETYTIDATGRRPGRIATQIAVLLMGKNRTDYARNKIPKIEVGVDNASKMRMAVNKLKSKTYARHSGYPGALKLESLEHVIKTKGAKEVLKKAVSGMLPKNKLRARMMKNLTIRD